MLCYLLNNVKISLFEKISLQLVLLLLFSTTLADQEYLPLLVASRAFMSTMERFGERYPNDLVIDVDVDADWNSPLLELFLILILVLIPTVLERMSSWLSDVKVPGLNALAAGQLPALDSPLLAAA